MQVRAHELRPGDVRDCGQHLGKVRVSRITEDDRLRDDRGRPYLDVWYENPMPPHVEWGHALPPDAKVIVTRSPPRAVAPPRTTSVNLWSVP